MKNKSIKICLSIIVILIELNLQAETPKDNRVKLIGKFNSYPSDVSHVKAWYLPGYHGGPMVRTLKQKINTGGRYSLKCSQNNLDEPTKFYSPLGRVDEWNAAGSDAVNFCYRPDISPIFKPKLICEAAV